MLAAGGLAAYLALGQKAVGAATPGRSATSAVTVVSVTTTGLVDFGPYDDRDNVVRDYDDRALLLAPSGSGVEFVLVPVKRLAAGVPMWSARRMSNGSEAFGYGASGQCLTAPGGLAAPTMARCDLGPSQQWWPLHSITILGATFAQYRIGGSCLTAGRAGALATLTPCAAARTKAALPQELAFFWGG